MIPEKGHSYEETHTATCEEAGAIRYKCSRCGDEYELPEDALGHDYKSVVTEPTCTEQGYTTHICDCGESYVDTYVPAAGHKWDAGVVTTEPTETAEGVKTFTCTVCGETRTESIPKLTPKPPAPANPFSDVAQGQYYYDPVLWAVSHDPQITNGTSPTTFSPDATCTRGQVVTFLWRAAGKPHPGGAANAFTDVKPSDYFYEAVLWAVQKGITNGTDATHFSPGATCTRGHVVTFLYRFENSPAVSGTNPFADVRASDYFYSPVLWAVGRGVTNGVSATQFGPANGCTRGQVVTFLYRDLHKTPAPELLQD